MIAFLIAFVNFYGPLWLLQQLAEWNARYYRKFGFVFLICASGRSTDEILAELKVNIFNERSCFLNYII